MTRFRRVVWNEGMLIGPHHFQLLDNYHEGLLNARVASLVSYEWGVLEVQISREAIANGSFELTRCRAVLPDGLWLDVPQTDVAPPARPIAQHFDPEAERLDVYLAVPSHRAGAANFQASGAALSPSVRYWQDAGAVVDETTGDNERQVSLARSNLRLLLGDEPRDGYTTVKIAEVARTATGQLSLSETFVPPALDVAASPWLISLLRQLIEVLITKSSTLGERRRQRGATLADFTTSEVAVFWLLHTVNSAIPRLAHLYRTRNVHPERLYFVMIELAGELMTFATDRHPKDMVAYDHTDLRGTFRALAAEIRDMLETVIPTRCVPIPLESVRESLYSGRVSDDRLLAEAEFYLAVRANAPVADLIKAVPRTLKIASRDVIDDVIAAALPGVTLTHISPPPASIPARVGFQYFQLDNSGRIWDDIRGAKTIAVYVPDEIPEEKLELYAIKP
ncbi:MAG TPA: type VI secretion system baseplate subunit TssK [Pyrinomonadaceae bacterium]|jgi:type VI secretion system protein ImpJ|nr:type VI secretion system baseplate subunit TssK [Pyrinomonadaceae bacterium]